MAQWIGDARKSHPLPLDKRNCNVSKDMGGAAGYRGRGYQKARQRALAAARRRSSLSGQDESQAPLQVDHIIPYRISGLTPHSNQATNLRVVDQENHKYADFMETGKERPRRRRLKGF